MPKLREIRDPDGVRPNKMREGVPFMTLDGHWNRCHDAHSELSVEIDLEALAVFIAFEFEKHGLDNNAENLAKTITANADKILVIRKMRKL